MKPRSSLLLRAALVGVLAWFLWLPLADLLRVSRPRVGAGESPGRCGRVSRHGSRAGRRPTSRRDSRQASARVGDDAWRGLRGRGSVVRGREAPVVDRLDRIRRAVCLAGPANPRLARGVGGRPAVCGVSGPARVRRNAAIRSDDRRVAPGRARPRRSNARRALAGAAAPARGVDGVCGRRARAHPRAVRRRRHPDRDLDCLATSVPARNLRPR